MSLENLVSKCADEQRRNVLDSINYLRVSLMSEPVQKPASLEHAPFCTGRAGCAGGSDCIPPHLQGTLDNRQNEF